MSDVERIVNANHERVRWAEEYEETRIAAIPAGSCKDGRGLWCLRGGQGSGRPTAGFDGSCKRAATSGVSNGVGRKDAAAERRQAYRTTALGCAMFTGSGAAFVGIGISMGHWMTVGVGLFLAVTFLICGVRAEETSNRMEEAK